MKKISSNTTFFLKWIFPIFWFGFLFVFLATALIDGQADKDPMFLVIPVVMTVFGFFLMKKLVWDLVDEVEDYGDYLVVKSKGREETIYLSSIMNVNASTNQNPPRITLRLRAPCQFGEEISFSPVSNKFSFNPFKKNDVAEDLIVRVDRARGRVAG